MLVIVAQLLPFQERWIKENPLLGSRWFWHVLFWTTRLLVYGTLWGIDDVFQDGNNILSATRRQLFGLPAEMLLVYVTLYVLIPNLLLNRKYVSFFLWLVAAILLAGWIKRLSFYYLYYPYFNPERELKDYFAFYKIVQTAVFLNLIVVSAATTIKLLKLWYLNQMTMQALVQEKLAAELNFLKAQIHPHFLFNTLNNIYGLALRKSENTAEVVLKLSGLLNYMLYDCRAPLVSLSKEIAYVRDYIALEQVRYGDRLDVSLTVEGEVHNKVIAPLIILTFVENSFKHGASAQTDKAWIQIEVKVSGSKFELKVANNNPAKPKQLLSSPKQGIGLTNVRRRLDLTYGDQYRLDIQPGEDAYRVCLELVLKDAIHPPVSPSSASTLQAEVAS